MVRSMLVTACRLATSPTRTSPDLANATTDGVVRAPSALGMTVGSPPSSTATTLFVVPRSMPTARAMLGYLRVVRLAIQPVCTGSRHHLDDQCRVDKILESGRLNFLSRAQRRGVPRMFPVLKEFRVVRLTTRSTPWSGGRPEDLELGAPVVDQVTADGRAVGGVPGADLPVDDGEGTAQRRRVTGEQQLDLGQQRLGRPLGHRERVLAQLPRQVLVVGPQPSGEREDDVEQPRQRLGRVEPGLEQPAVAVVRQGAVGEVQVAVETVLVDQHPPLLVVLDGRLTAYGVG